MEPISNHTQPKVTGGEQKVVLDSAVTGETDELDPKFEEGQSIPDKSDVGYDPAQ